MRKLFKTSIFLFLGFGALLSCSSDDDIIDDNPILQTDPPIILDCDYFMENRTLTNNPNAAVDYIIPCRMRVGADIKIEPGVVIEFEREAAIIIFDEGVSSSSLSAIGTSEQPIILRGVRKEKGLWAGIEIASRNPLNELKHVILEDAGNDRKHGADWSGGLMAGTDGAFMKITHTKISNCKGFGINAHNKYANLVFENNIITQNDVPIKLHPQNLKSLTGSSSYGGNIKDFVFVDAYATSIFEDLTWSKLDIPYKLKADFSAGHGGLGISANVIIEAGVEIIMTNGSMITVGHIHGPGSLQMNGTAQDKIIIKGEQDVVGYWEHVRYANSNTLNKMSHVEIHNAGHPLAGNHSDPNGALHVDNTYLRINDVTFVRCFDFAISRRGSNFEQINTMLIDTPQLIGDWDNDPI